MSLFEDFIQEPDYEPIYEVEAEGFKTPFKLRKLSAVEYMKASTKFEKSGRDPSANPASFMLEVVLDTLIYPDLEQKDVAESVEKIYELRTGKKVKLLTPRDVFTAMFTPVGLDKFLREAGEKSKMFVSVDNEEITKENFL